MKCKECGTNVCLVSIPECWRGFSTIPITCDKCDSIFWVDNKTLIETAAIGTEASLENIPSISKGSTVFITNKEHRRYLHPAIVIDKDHVHYRIEFLDLLVVWVPAHWVDVVPNNDSI